MKKRILLSLLFIAVLAVFLTDFIADRMTITITEAIEDPIQPNDEVKIRITRYSDDARADIVDQDKIQDILTAFSTIRLQKANDFTSHGAYGIMLEVNRSYRFVLELLEDHNYIRFKHNNSVNIYKIVNNVDLWELFELNKLEFRD